MSAPRISVVMATYNGSQFVREQLESVLQQIGAVDEVIVVDDASTDDTAAVALGLKDSRIKVIRNSLNRGHVASFERGLRLAQGDVIMLADQDDIWPVDRVSRMVGQLEIADLCVGTLRIFSNDLERDGKIINLPRNSRGRVDDVRSICLLFGGRLPYYGSAMALTARFRDLALPFPPSTMAHDHWLALLGHTSHRVARLDYPVVLRREHGDNLSSRRRSIVAKLQYRVHLADMLWSAHSRYRSRGLRCL